MNSWEQARLAAFEADWDAKRPTRIDYHYRALLDSDIYHVAGVHRSMPDREQLKWLAYLRAEREYIEERTALEAQLALGKFPW